jgi:hypothetical protein
MNEPIGPYQDIFLFCHETRCSFDIIIDYRYRRSKRVKNTDRKNNDDVTTTNTALYRTMDSQSKAVTRSNSPRIRPRKGWAMDCLNKEGRSSIQQATKLLVFHKVGNVIARLILSMKEKYHNARHNKKESIYWENLLVDTQTLLLNTCPFFSIFSKH